MFISPVREGTAVREAKECPKSACHTSHVIETLIVLFALDGSRMQLAVCPRNEAEGASTSLYVLRVREYKVY